MRYKCCWVVRGFEQLYGQDYDQTFASTLPLTVVRWLLAYCNITGRQLRQIDFLTAFLDATMDEDVYVEQPTGYEIGSNLVCLLLKALYGLKQAPRLWQKDFGEIHD